MDIYQFFSCLTTLPIRIDSIVGFIRDRGLADNVFFCEVDIDPDILWAQLKVHKQKRLYGDDYLEYEIQYSKHLSVPQQRLACCKELLHILDDQDAMASTQDSVELLIHQMSIPPQSGIALPAVNDHTGIIRALLIMVPRDCLCDFKASYDNGEITADEVAKATGIPVEYARITLQDFWQELSDLIC
ncbi:hypothetical protein ACGYLV_11885 [Sulfitobacter sp. M21595]|uniref:hypothetical protein n=1 Tax=Sulfitobacter sp. M21595 TaxID=3368574 RepID=UPI003745F963